MEKFSTTDLYLAAFMKMYCTGMTKRKAGDKVIFEFEFENDLVCPETLQTQFFENDLIQSFVSSVKEIRNDIYKTMRK